MFVWRLPWQSSSSDSKTQWQVIFIDRDGTETVYEVSTSEDQARSTVEAKNKELTDRKDDG